MRHLILILVLFLTSCINDVNSTSNVDTSYQIVQSVPDIRVGQLVPFNGIFTLNQTKDISIKILNAGTVNTTENITIFYPSMYGYDISFNNTQTTTNNPVANIDNNLFTVIPMGGGILITTNTILEPGKVIIVTFKLKATKSLINNISNIIAIPYTGGEINLLNNSAKINITTL